MLAIMILSIMGISYTVEAKSYNKNVGSGNVTCDSDNSTYYITGSTNKNNITVDGKNIKIYLRNVNINLRDDGFKEKAAINIKGKSTVTIYLEGDNCLKGGKNKGLKISCDLNYRGKLWSREEARAAMTKLCEYVDVCISNEEDAKDVFGIEAENTDIYG